MPSSPTTTTAPCTSWRQKYSSSCSEERSAQCALSISSTSGRRRAREQEARHRIEQLEARRAAAVVAGRIRPRGRRRIARVARGAARRSRERSLALEPTERERRSVGERDAGAAAAHDDSDARGARDPDAGSDHEAAADQHPPGTVVRSSRCVA